MACILNFLFTIHISILSIEWALYNKSCNFFKSVLLWDQSGLKLEGWASATFFCNCNVFPFQFCVLECLPSTAVIHVQSQGISEILFFNAGACVYGHTRCLQGSRAHMSEPPPRTSSSIEPKIELICTRNWYKSTAHAQALICARSYNLRIHKKDAAAWIRTLDLKHA